MNAKILTFILTVLWATLTVNAVSDGNTQLDFLPGRGTRTNSKIFSDDNDDNGDEEEEEDHDNDGHNKRRGKIFSIFSIVQFKNVGCKSTMTLPVSGTTSTYRNGTCLTSAECSQKGGSSSGTCAGGFGVCCVFMTSTCGASVSQNCSYIKNPGYSSAYTSTSSCSFTINKCDSSVCSFRLDFENFQLNVPSGTAELNGGACLDTFVVTLNTGQSIPTICGTNTGQHIYLDAGTLSTDTATLAFAFSGTFSRYWDVKVTQIPCTSTYRQPSGCLQYTTGLSGRFTTFNFAGYSSAYQHLASQNYRYCVRQALGYCCVQWMVCSDSYSFNFNTAGIAIYTSGNIGTNCALDYLVIENSSCTGGGSLTSRYCGGYLNCFSGATSNAKILDCTAPFEASFVTDAAVDATATTIANGNRGLCLMYTQIPCSINTIG